MKILAVDSSGKSASVCILEDGILIASNYQNIGQTHSKTLLPMIDNMLSSTGEKLSNIDVFAVSQGPGSFTGIRIGISVIKGLCTGLLKPCLGVSTLVALAGNLHGSSDIICSVTDARRDEVYCGVYKFEHNNLKTIYKEQAISLSELKSNLEQLENNIILLGDGALLCAEYLKDSGINFNIAPPNLQYQNAYGVAYIANEMLKTGAVAYSHHELKPTYLRLSQAEKNKIQSEENVNVKSN